MLLHLPDWSEYVRESIEDVSFAAGNSPMALLRIRALLLDLLVAVPEGRRAPIVERREMIEHRLQEFPLIWQRVGGTRPTEGSSPA